MLYLFIYFFQYNTAYRALILQDLMTSCIAFFFSHASCVALWDANASQSFSQPTTLVQTQISQQLLDVTFMFPIGQVGMTLVIP